MASELLLALPVREVLVLPWAWTLIAAAYLLGSVPFGLLIVKQFSGIDLRAFGSGNIGTSNAVRAMGRGWGFLVFCLDFMKGCAPVLIAHWVVTDPATRSLLQVLIGTAAVLGHCYSVYLRFRGGKGVATGCGAIVAIDPFVFVCGGAAWLVGRVLTRYAGLASILMGLTFPVAAWFLDRDQPAFVAGCGLLTLLILVRHRDNIRRMLSGTEPRIGEKIGDTPAARHHG